MSIRPGAMATPASTSGQLSVVSAGSDLTTARPDVPVAYWQFDTGTDPGAAGADIVHGEPGDFFLVAGSSGDNRVSTPANLEYAFPLPWAGHAPEIIAYRVVSTPYTGTYDELDASLTPGEDYSETAADGDGSPGQYVVFNSNASIGEGAAIKTSAELIAAYGFDPFDPTNQGSLPSSGAFGVVGATLS